MYNICNVKQIIESIRPTYRTRYRRYVRYIHMPTYLSVTRFSFFVFLTIITKQPHTVRKGIGYVIITRMQCT